MISSHEFESDWYRPSSCMLCGRRRHEHVSREYIDSNVKSENNTDTDENKN